MTAITDEYMQSMLTKTWMYTIVLLKPGPQWSHPDMQKIKWEHGRSNFSLRAEGALAIVCPVGAETLSGMGIFNRPLDETRQIMNQDPGVQSGVFIYEAYSCRSFPGDSLP